MPSAAKKNLKKGVQQRGEKGFTRIAYKAKGGLENPDSNDRARVCLETNSTEKRTYEIS